ncbi:hypothetical protein ACDQ55_15900 [Chitinophaga sp. 30R24]|uniref:hypothetical protein n=1 Tax=Chitinophaga sp. 30R24 TaxID=3248838 RepID=UPI003B8F300D
MKSVNEKDTARKEMFLMALKHANVYASTNKRRQLEEQLYLYKRLCLVLIITLGTIALCSVLLNIKLINDATPFLLSHGMWTDTKI